MTQLTTRDLIRLAGVHPDLVRVVTRARTMAEFFVIEGVRSEARQRALMAEGASKTLASRHLTGHAVDLGAMADGALTWAAPAYHELAATVKEAAAAEGVPIEWGGDWKGFFDGPHFQLPWADYPA